MWIASDQTVTCIISAQECTVHSAVSTEQISTYKRVYYASVRSGKVQKMYDERGNSTSNIWTRILWNARFLELLALGPVPLFPVTLIMCAS